MLVRLLEWRLNYMLLFNIEDGKEKLKTIRNYFLPGDICPGNADLQLGIKKEDAELELGAPRGRGSSIVF